MLIVIMGQCVNLGIEELRNEVIGECVNEIM